MALEADRLSFSYGEVPVLSCASFGLPQGGFAALIGPNGAGKSTLLKLLLGELSPSSGAVRLLGQDTARFRNWRRHLLPVISSMLRKNWEILFFPL